MPDVAVAVEKLGYCEDAEKQGELVCPWEEQSVPREGVSGPTLIVVEIHLADIFAGARPRLHVWLNCE